MVLFFSTESAAEDTVIQIDFTVQKLIVVKALGTFD